MSMLTSLPGWLSVTFACWSVASLSVTKSYDRLLFAVLSDKRLASATPSKRTVDAHIG